MPLSIRYDLTFLEQLIHFTNDQLALSNTADGFTEPQRERDANQSLELLCDSIDDFYALHQQGEKDAAQAQATHERK